MPRASKPPGLASDLQGASRLTVDAVLGVTGLVEAMHRNIASPSSLAGVERAGPTTGITGLVYRSVRGVSRVVGKSLDLALGTLAPLMGEQPAWPAREAVLAALNGVLGDHLEATGNPLAIPMSLRRHDADSQPTGKVLILIHGLCMNDQQWLRDGHDHGQAIAAALGYTLVYLHYNSGRHISTNGRQFAQLLHETLTGWPVPVQDVVIIGHSMGGLVARSAVHYAAQAGLAWPVQLSHMIFLGTPHHGAPLERAGSVIDMLLGATPYSAPLARIGMVRSAGIQDLRHGNVLDGHWGRQRPSASQQLNLPLNVQCYAIAAVQGDSTQKLKNHVLGDGLVTVDSALGRHRRASHSLCFAPENTLLLTGTNHFDLLSSMAACRQMVDWINQVQPARKE